jgi:hypothetical protein
VYIYIYSQIGAATSKLKYRVRVCIEGIPTHAAQVETIAKLFPPTFVENIDTETPTENEKARVCAWVWTPDPDGFAKEGVLRLEEPIEFTEEFHNDFFTRVGNMELPALRNEAAAMLDCKVIIHIDCVFYYTNQRSHPGRATCARLVAFLMTPLMKIGQLSILSLGILVFWMASLNSARLCS